MPEIYESVHTHGDLGIPLGCVIEVDEDDCTVAAYEKGGTFSKEGMLLLPRKMQTFSFSHCVEDKDIEVRAVDIQAAMHLMRRRYQGVFDVCVCISVHLGKIDLGEPF